MIEHLSTSVLYNGKANKEPKQQQEKILHSLKYKQELRNFIPAVDFETTYARSEA